MPYPYKYAILSLLLLFGVTIPTSQAQTPQVTYQLENDESGATKTYVARDQIVMKPGFKFQSPGSNTFTAKIDAGLLFPPTENTYALPNGTITTDPTQGAVVGSIPGQFAVSPSGAATYTIPIECPSGINGMQPNVSLVYNSQGGNGIAGWGWGITGLSSISVIPKTIFSNSEIKSINLVEQTHLQKFAFDGNTLILESGTTGIKAYITENKTYAKIINDNTKFIVTTKDGTVMEYAQRLVPKKILTSQVTSGTYSWLLTKVTDLNGNYITYSYKLNNANTQTVLDKIEYTGNGSIAPTLKIEFEYIEKTEIQKQYIGGYYFEDFYLLKNITVKSGSFQLRKYELTHLQSNDKYFLTKVNLKGENNEKLNATVVEWGGDNEVISVNTTTINNPSTYLSEITRRVFSSGDVDGDGISDIIEFFRRDDYTFRNGDNYSKTTADHVKVNKMKLENGNVVYDQTILNCSLGASTSMGDFKNINSMGYLAGFNGSQKRTLLMPCYSEYNGIKSFKLKDAKANIDLNCPLKYTSCMPKFVVGDVNNDGIDEIVIIEKTDNSSPAIPDYQNGSVVYIKKSNLSTEYLGLQDNLIAVQLNFDSRIPGSSTHPEIKEVFLSDFNADGLKDLMVCTSAGSFFMKNNGGVKGTDGVVRVEFTQLSGINTSLAMSDGQSVIKGGDFNGDGMLDFLLYDGDDGFSLHLNNGIFDFTNHTVANLSLIEDVFEGVETSTKNDDKDDFIITDFNHDGKSDLIIIDVDYEKACGWELAGLCMSPYARYVNTTIKWYVSNGTSFTDDNSLSINNEHYYYKGYATSGDFDGDAREDLFSFGSNIYNNNNTSEYGYVYGSFNTNFEANHVKSFFSGLGSKTTLSYQPLTFTKYNNLDFYVKGTTSVYPIADVQAPSYCVRNVLDAAENGSLNNFYSYNGAKVHLQGKGFLGFANQTVNDLLHNTKTIVSSEMDYDYCLPTKQIQTIMKSDNEIISISEKQFVNSLFGSVYKSLPSKTIETDNLTGLSKTTEYLSYDGDGNLLTSRTTQGQLITEQTFIYDQFGNWSWGDNKPVSVTTTNIYMGDSISQNVQYNYDSNTGRLSSETVNAENLLYTKTEYDSYDDFGHPTVVRVKAKDANGIEQTRTSSITYTPSGTSKGHFVTSKTNVLGETTTYNWDETRGLLNSATAKSKTTYYTYDGFGRLKETKYPDGNRKTEVLQWAGGGPAGAVYYSYAQISGSTPVTTWYDALGREIQKDTYGLYNQNARKVSVSTEYYTLGANKGRLYRVSEPYFEGDAKIWAETYSVYDPYGRPTTVETLMGNITTVYNGLNTTVTTPESSKSTTLNNSGFVASSTVNQKMVSYTYYPSGLTKTAIPQEGQALSMEYNIQGKRTKLTDPDAGVIEAKYNGFGELVEEKQKVHSDNFIITSHRLDPFTGRLDSINRNGEITSYNYDNLNRVISIEIANQHKQIFSYDAFDRVTNIREEIGTKVLDRGTEYDALGRVKKETYPSGYFTVNTYDKDYGFLTEVKDKHGRQLWKAIQENARGQLTEVQRGGITTNFGFDSKGLPTSIQASGIVNMTYLFDNDGNLNYRQDNLNSQNIQKEAFIYDSQNRLINWNIYQNGSSIAAKQDSINYNSIGNIERKSDLGNFLMKYGVSGKPHALDSIIGIPDNFPISDLDVTYTDFKKIKTLTEDNKYYILTYGIDNQRRKSEYKINGVTQKTKYYLGDYEEETDNLGNIKKIHYLSGGAILINTNGVETLYYGYSDYQGNLIALANEAGAVVERYAYDSWGARRNPSDWTQADTRTSWIVSRGYTMHEHLDAFGIINMNGRVYDPLTASFFSPDPFVQAPGNWLNYNRYAYCYGNPFKYVDPDGEWIHIVIGAVVGGIINLGIKAYQGKVNSWGDGFAAFGIGAAAGAIGAATGGAAFAAAGGAAGGAGGFLAGAAGGAVGTAFSSPVLSMGNTAYFGDPMMTGKQYLMGIAGGALLGGSINGITALANGRSFLNGDLTSSTAPITPTVSQTAPNQQSNNTQPNQNPNQATTQQQTNPNQSNNNSFTVIRTERPQVLSLEGQSINIERPQVNGYINELSLKTDLYHNFPTAFDDVIIQNGGMAQRISDGAFMYTAPGTINGVQGVYTIGINQQNIIFHRCFYEWNNFLSNF